MTDMMISIIVENEKCYSGLSSGFMMSISRISDSVEPKTVWPVEIWTMKFQGLNIRVINVSMNYILDGSVRGELEEVHAEKCTSDIHEGKKIN
jgi:hypothetical protein